MAAVNSARRFRMFDRTRACPAIVLMLGCVMLAGCGSKKPQLMPTPNLYTHPEFDPFADVPPALQGNVVDVLYITDRTPETEIKKQVATPERMLYAHRRSRSAAFGVAQLRIGSDDLTWEELVRLSRSETRDRDLDLDVISVREIGRFAPTPPRLVISDTQVADVLSEAENEAHEDAERRFTEELTARLAKTPRKEVYLFVHGFNVDFDGSVRNIGELWHFLGREGVPIVYSWPAGQGTLRAYEFTNQSVLFTGYHFKQALRLIAACPAVEKVHLIGHSRGTAVVTNGVRELYIEMRGTEDVQKKLKLGTCVLAAADLDIDVVTQQYATERVGRAVEAVVIYIFEHDKALSFSRWLAGGVMRLGDVDPDLFDEDEMNILRESRRLQIVDARITKPGPFGHNYFQQNPAVSSDLILFLRYHLPPGGEHGRPLEISESGFWIIDDDYPGSLDAPWFRTVRQQLARTAAVAVPFWPGANAAASAP